MRYHGDTEVDENRVGILHFVFLDLSLVKQDGAIALKRPIRQFDWLPSAKSQGHSCLEHKYLQLSKTSPFWCMHRVTALFLTLDEQWRRLRGTLTSPRQRDLHS
jgi:hypothetical protein